MSITEQLANDLLKILFMSAVGSALITGTIFAVAYCLSRSDSMGGDK